MERGASRIGNGSEDTQLPISCYVLVFVWVGYEFVYGFVCVGCKFQVVGREK